MSWDRARHARDNPPKSRNRDYQDFENRDFRFFIRFLIFWKNFQKSDINNHEIFDNLISQPVKSLNFPIELRNQLSIAIAELFWDLLDFEIQTDIWKSQLLCRGGFFETFLWRFLRLGLVDFFSDKMKRFGVAKPSNASRSGFDYPEPYHFLGKKSTATAQRLRRWPAAATDESRSVTR